MCDVTHGHSIEAVHFLHCTGADGNICTQESRGNEKQLIDFEWSNPYIYSIVLSLKSRCIIHAREYAISDDCRKCFSGNTVDSGY